MQTGCAGLHLVFGLSKLLNDLECLKFFNILPDGENALTDGCCSRKLFVCCFKIEEARFSPEGPLETRLAFESPIKLLKECLINESLLVDGEKVERLGELSRDDSAEDELEVAGLWSRSDCFRSCDLFDLQSKPLFKASVVWLLAEFISFPSAPFDTFTQTCFFRYLALRFLNQTYSEINQSALLNRERL